VTEARRTSTCWTWRMKPAKRRRTWGELAVSLRSSTCRWRVSGKSVRFQAATTTSLVATW
jgi:hypothetical protein